MPGAPVSPFTRLPTTPVTSDIYDKLAAVQNQTQQQTGAIAQQQAAQDKTVSTIQSDLAALQKKVSGSTATLTLAYRQVTSSTFIALTDFTVHGILGAGATFTLPDAKTCAGQIFVVKNDASSGGNSITMGSTNSQKIDGAAPGSIVLAFDNAYIFQSTGLGWITIANF